MSEQKQMMNCAKFEEALAADPRRVPAGGDEHLASCTACRTLRDEYLELEQRIERALAVPVPKYRSPLLDDLDVDEVKVAKLPVRRRFSAPVGFGLAAVVSLAAWLSLTLQQPDVSQLSLAEQVVAHLDHETSSRVISNVSVSERTLNSVVSKDIAELDRDVGLITYARSCIINGKSVPHLVVQGRNGPITLLLMPDEPIAAATPLAGNAINGVILPVGNGSVAIIAERGEPLQEIRQKVVDSIKWKT
ncbi:MAG: DUF3379 family protein [Woeseia sp.]|nr:DUF3379 domain-containing protein [Woeseia sp.]MBT8097910.1 DUF3379 domain-containing protein [Woeseia sp.]NNE60756.1 DUF3379 family protein [Woeseia sp.]NNL55396.1 DUF3379 family protein [Woeseia sp.]